MDSTEERCKVKDKFDSVFAIWKEYENITMHFNDLIIKLRIRALGGITIIISILGVLTKEHGINELWGLLTLISFFLCIAWTALWVLDSNYYNKLLEGSVEEVINLEEKIIANAKVYGLEEIGGIKLSTTIKKKVETSRKLISSKNIFYSLVFIILLILFCISSLNFLVIKIINIVCNN